MIYHKMFYAFFVLISGLMWLAPQANAQMCTATATPTYDTVSRCHGKGAAECMLTEWNTQGCKCACAGNCTGAFVPKGWEGGFAPQTCMWDSKNKICREDLGTDDPIANLFIEINNHTVDQATLAACDRDCKKQALFSCKMGRNLPTTVPQVVPQTVPVNPYSVNPEFNRCLPQFGPDASTGAKIILIGYCCYKAGAIAAGFFVANVPGAAVAACAP